MGLDSMSGCVLERVWMSRTCRRRIRNGKVMVLFLGNVDFEVVDDVGIGFGKKRDCGSWVSRIESRNAADDLEDRLKNVNCTGLEKWVWQWW